MALEHFTLFFITLSFFSLESAHGRENFSKFTHVVNSQINENTNNNNNNVNETNVVPDKIDPLNKQNQEEQDPLFIPETQNAYGLYGRGNVPTEKTATYTENNNDNGGSNYYSNNNNNDDDEYVNGAQEDMITDTSLMGRGYTTPLSSRGYRNGYNTDEQGNRGQYKNGETMYSSEEELDNSNLYDKQYNSNNPYKSENRYNSNNPYKSENRYNSNQYDTENKYSYNYDQEYYNSANKYNNNDQQQNNNGANKYNNEQQNYNGANKYSYNGANRYNNNGQQNNGANKYNVEKQGMSDTRFLENGRYFHDIDNEKNNYRRDYNTEQYYGSNNENVYEYKNNQYP